MCLAVDFAALKRAAIQKSNRFGGMIPFPIFRSFYDAICARFEGKEKHICKSPFSWVNDGSHFAQDDIYLSMDSSMVEPYLEVFRSVFEKPDHSAHYKMMMRDAYQERATPAAAA